MIKELTMANTGLPVGWEMKTLGDVCDIKTGKSNAQDADVNGEFTFFDRSKKIKKSNRYLFDCEALIIPGEGSQFFPRYYSGKFDLHQRVYSISNFIEDINIHYIQYFLIFNHKHFEKVAVGATVKSLRLRHFTGIEFPLPPLPQQKQIVAILDKAFAAIDAAKANAEQNLQNSKELFESYSQNVFENKRDDWEEKKIIEICRLINGKAYKKKELLDEGKYRVLRVGNLFTNKHWYHSDLELAEDKYIDKGDLIYAWSASFGPRIWTDEKVIYHYHIWKVIPDNKLITKEFLHLLFEWDKEKIKKAQGTGTTMMHIGKGSMEDREILLPPLNQQKQIVNKLDALSAECEKLEAIYTQKLADLEEMKKSVLQKAFSGQLNIIN